MNTICILGAGPSGMMAAHAAVNNGYDIHILDKDPDKTRRNSGVYYLHSQCDLALSSTILHQRVIGDKDMPQEEVLEAYRKKVYGDLDVGSSSILEARYNPDIEVYNSSEAIEHLWQMYGHTIQKYTIGSMFHLKVFREDYVGVVSTIPAEILFPESNLYSIPAYVHPSTSPMQESFIYYNVSKTIPWYRCSAVFGSFVAEYSSEVDKKEEYKTVVKVIGKDKPLPVHDWLISTGRYGAWDKSFLTDTVYRHVTGELRERNW